ncbi:MAG: winged helix-turn-helix transcriptional regulator [Desulfobacteraceae bacterium]|nr:MAG: winged helix-turn-helix transcriptional regulator [Desulfobacteraceae bacterium]
MDKDDLYMLRLMGEIDRNGITSQRELSRRLDVSLGLVNSFLNRLIGKGYFKIKTMPRNRVKYFLTPEGLARKGRLTVEYLQYSLHFYKDIKKLLLSTYSQMVKENVKTILFFGEGEVSELAYLYLKLTPIQLAGIVDHEKQGKDFFEFQINTPDKIQHLKWDRILLTRLDHPEKDINVLIQLGVDSGKITTI